MFFFFRFPSAFGTEISMLLFLFFFFEKSASNKTVLQKRDLQLNIFEEFEDLQRFVDDVMQKTNSKDLRNSEKNMDFELKNLIHTDK